MEILEQLDNTLYEHQKSGAEFLLSRPRAILADEMGIGKTLTALYAAFKSGYKNVLVICPKTAKSVWKSEIDKWLKIVPVSVLDGNESKRNDCLNRYINTGGFLIANYEQLSSHGYAFSNMDFNLIIFDEAHKLKNYRSMRSKNAKSLCSHGRHKKTPVWLITGTPIVNRAHEMWPLLNICEPDTYTSYWRWVFDNFYTQDLKFGNRTVKNVLGPKNLEAFMRSLSPYMIRRMKSDVLDLPPLVVEDVVLSMEGKQLSVYKGMEKDFFAWLSEQGDFVSASLVITKIMRLKQIGLSHELFLPEGISGVKTDTLLDMLEGLNSPALVFSQFKSYLKRLQPVLSKGGYKVAVIDGDTDNSERAKLVAEFQDGKYDVMLLSITAGSESITLTKASHVFFLDLPWNPATLEQAIGRAYRSGQTKTVNVYKLLLDNSIEGKIDRLISDKTNIINGCLPVHRLLEA